MSLSIRAISKAKCVGCKGYVDDKPDGCCGHDEIVSFPLGRERLKVGCYVPGRGSHSRSITRLMPIGLMSFTGWCTGSMRPESARDFTATGASLSLSSWMFRVCRRATPSARRWQPNSTATLSLSLAKQGSTLRAARKRLGCGMCTVTLARHSRLPATVGVCPTGDVKGGIYYLMKHTSGHVTGFLKGDCLVPPLDHIPPVEVP